MSFFRDSSRVPMHITPFGEGLRDYAKYKGIELAELAEKSSISYGVLHAHLTGKRYPKLDDMVAYLEVLSDSEEEYWALLKRLLERIPEYQFGMRRVRYKQTKNKKQ